MPTRKDKTNVAPIYREQVFIPASGTTLMKQKARPKVAGRPVSSGAVEIVSPEFDLLTGIRGITNLPKGFLKTNKLPQGENLYYRQLDKSSKGLERAKQVGVIDTKSSGGANFTTSRGTTLRIGKTFDTPFFAKGSLWYNNVDDMDVIVGKDNPLLDWKMITQHGRVTENAMKAANRRTPFYNGATNQAPTELFELYRRYPGIGYRNVTYGFPTMPITGLNTVAEQMKCGGRRKAQLGLDIREGGIAIPIAPNMYYMDGRSHDEGGIGIGPNNKNGLEVEGGEVVKVGKNDVKVFSNVPLLRGVSPAKLVLGGANPNVVFKAQEEFKDRNRINDDGTTYEVGGEKIYTPSKSIQRQIQETGRITIGGAPTIGGLRTAKYVKGLATAKGYAKQANKIFTKVNNFVNNSLQGLINKHKITPNQADAYKKFYNEIVGVNGVNIPKTASFFLNNDNREMKFGGSMIYTINGNVKNGLTLRPKATLGTKKEDEEKKKKNPNEARYASRIKKGKAQEVTAKPVVTYNEAADKNPDKYRYTRAARFKNEVKTPLTGGGTQSKDGRWIGQYKTTNVGDWIGLGSNLAGTIASYFMTKNAINKIPEPIKPIMAQAAKLKTRYNVEPQLSEIREAEQMNRATVRRNTQSSNTSLAREQRLMNEARGARNTLYGQKENIETQLINKDRLNRQAIMMENVNKYNEYLNRVTATKMAKNEMRISNINNLISGLTGSVNSILGNIESRRATNNTLRAIAAANPNVDARLIGGFDYYIDPITKKKYNKNQQYVGTING